MADKFLLIDGSSLLHRAFFALPPLTTRAGVPTGAVYGLCNMLARLLEEVQPKYMAVAFDKSRRTFRSALYADYKGQRKPTPPELKSQFPLSMEVLAALDITALELDDYEADDIIGTLAKNAPEGVETIIVTGDKDELQLIDGRTRVFYTKRGISEIKIYDEAAFAADYEGLAPEQIIELKGLMGDASDNIPGVPGVGPKTALKLIKEYGTVAQVLANVDNIKGKSLQAKLAENRESALLSQRLAVICTKAPVDCGLAGYELKGVKPEARELLASLEFRNLYERFAALLGGDGSPDFSLFGEVTEENAPAADITPVTPANAAAVFAALTQAGETAFLACEGGGALPELYFARAEIFAGGQVYVLESDAGGADGELWRHFYAWLADSAAPKAVCDSKEGCKICRCLGFAPGGIREDAALAAYLDEPGRSGYSLPELQQRYLTQAQGTASENLAALLPLLQERLRQRELLKLYYGLELPLAAVLAQMECDGIKPDMELLAQQQEDMAHRLAQLEARAVEAAGEEFNLKSPKQLGVVLFEHLGLPVIKKTKTGYSTDVKVLELLADKHPLVPLILEHRKLQKLQSTYLEGLQPLCNARTGRIHTHFQQTVTVTGRLSSTDPNLQNIPARTEEGREIRKIFIPGAGYDYLMSCDYSQVELRILACIAKDELLLDSFRHGQDVHARTASEVFGVPLDAVTKEMRTHAKAVNFGIVYGISDFGLANQLGVSRSEAAGFIKSYFARYTGVKAYMESIIAEARANGYVATLMGRRRYLPDIKSSNFNIRGAAERTAINTPIQGTAADIMKLAMIRVAAALQESGMKSRILLQVHDELVLEVPAAEKEAAAKLVKEAMENAAVLEVPLLADVSFGRNWAEAK